MLSADLTATWQKSIAARVDCEDIQVCLGTKLCPLTMKFASVCSPQIFLRTINPAIRSVIFTCPDGFESLQIHEKEYLISQIQVGILPIYDIYNNAKSQFTIHRLETETGEFSQMTIYLSRSISEFSGVKTEGWLLKKNKTAD